MLLPRRGLKKCIHAVSNFIALIPFRSIRQMEVNYSGFKFENFYQILEKENSCLVFTYPIKLKLGRFTSYSCCEFADNKILCWRIFFSELFLSKVFLRHSIPHYCLKCRCKVKISVIKNNFKACVN